MLKRLSLISLFAMSVVTLVGTEAMATKVCIYYNPAGVCRLWSGSVECQITDSGLGNITKDPTTNSCLIEQLPGTTSIHGLVLCDTPGKKVHVAPGIAPADFTGTFDAITAITNVDKNGKAITFSTASLSDTQLPSLNSACPNPNFTAFEFVPCAMRAVIQAIDVNTGLPEATKTFDCTLPNCSTLTWDKVAQKIERREYQCCEVGVDAGCATQ